MGGTTRVERRCELRVGGVSLAFSIVREGAAGAVPRRRGPRIGPLVLIAAATLPAIGALAYVAPVPNVPYRVSVAVPSAGALPAPPRVVRPVGAPRAVSAAVGVTRAESPVAAAEDGAERAVRAALRTGEMQEWDGAEGAHGFVVAGPAEGSAGCRALSVLTRQADGTSDVESRRACLREGER